MRFVFIAVVCFVLSGCSFIGFMEEMGCPMFSGKLEDHCFSDAAERQEDPDTCAKIKAEDFNAIQGPAPRDKCYLKVATASGDPSGCKNIEGGMISYSEEECLMAAAITAKDPSICEQITGTHSNAFSTFNKETCLKKLGELGVQPGDVPPKDEEEEQPRKPGGCKYDSDCKAFCEGQVLWKQGCNPRTDTCEKTFDTDCSAQIDTAGEFSFAKICDLASVSCISDTSAINAQKQKLSNEVKDWTSARQTITQMMLDANKNCLNALAEVTNKLIIDTATKLASPPKIVWEVVADATNNVVDELAKNPQSMDAEEFISLNCNLYKALQTDLDVLAKRVEKNQEQVRELNGLISG